MLTATEVVFIKELLVQLASEADVSEYTQGEVDQALELISSLEPTSTEDFLKVVENSLGDQ